MPPPGLPDVGQMTPPSMPSVSAMQPPGGSPGGIPSFPSPPSAPGGTPLPGAGGGAGGQAGAITEDPAVTVCFSVEVTGQSFGYWTSCDGLGVEVVVEQREEGGNNFFVHQLPGRLKYTNVKLSRVVNSDTRHVAKWIMDMATGYTRTTVKIAARRADRSIVAQWELEGAIPVKWTGPQLNVEGPKVATETLEIAHHGFLPGAGTSR